MQGRNDQTDIVWEEVDDREAPQCVKLCMSDHSLSYLKPCQLRGGVKKKWYFWVVPTTKLWSKYHFFVGNFFGL